MGKIVVQSLWMGPPLSKLEILSIKSFMKCGHSFHLYTYHPVDNIPKGTIIKDANKIFPIEDLLFLQDDKLPFSDIFRYKMLYEKGGYWVDLDMICLKKLDFKEPFVFSSERTIQKGGLRNRKGTSTSNIGILKAPKKSEFYLELYEACLKIVNRRKRARKPIEFMVLMRDYLKIYDYQQYVLPPELFCPLDWWNTKEAFFPPCCPDKYDVPGYPVEDMLENSYTIHMWRSIMRRKKIDPNQKYDKKSLYEILKKKYKL